MTSGGDDSVPNSSGDIQLTINHHGEPHTFTFHSAATLVDLSDAVANSLSIPPSHQKFLITPKTGLQRPPFSSPPLPLSSLTSKKIVLMGSTPAQISALSTTISKVASSYARRTAAATTKSVKPAVTRDWQRARDEARYTFHTLRPLPYFADSDRALAYLTRLRDDPGVRAAMRRHRFSVGLLTEMDPALHTTHESRTLGLNRNAGEAIELRLRTDAGDGFRDYGTIRKTLCHELAHNVYGEHDRNFWELCKEIEREVLRDDWRSGGRRVGNEEVYVPEEGEMHVDHGGWTGGEYVLGRAEGTQGRAGGGAAGLSRREILAKAAEERLRRTSEVDRAAADGNARSSEER